MLAIWIELSEYSENLVIHFLITNRTGCTVCTFWGDGAENNSLTIIDFAAHW